MRSQLARKPENTYHHGDLRDALIKAALREAEQGGAEAISIKALAKQLGVSQPAPYRHFADREALLEAVTAEAFRQFNVIMREAIEHPGKGSELSRFAQAALRFLAWGRRFATRFVPFGHCARTCKASMKQTRLRRAPAPDQKSQPTQKSRLPGIACRDRRHGGMRSKKTSMHFDD